MSTFKFGSYNTADAPTWTALTSLANGSYALSSAIDNTSGDASGGLFLYGDAVLNLGASATAGSGSPYIQLYALWSPDGTNFPTPPGATAGAAGLHMLASSALLVASAAFQIVMFPPISLRPGKVKLMIYNGSGVAFPASGVTCSLYRYGEQAA